MTSKSKLQWIRVLDPEELPQDRVKTVVAGHMSLAMTHFEGKYSALDSAWSAPGRTAG